jgi:protein gp37
MAETTGISWADATANFWEGRTQVSGACDNCYAMTRNQRFGGGVAANWGPHGPRKHIKAGAKVVAATQRTAASFIAKHGRRPRVFINSLADWADNHQSIEQAWRDEMWAKCIAYLPEEKHD